jgi:hypothetical protein
MGFAAATAWERIPGSALFLHPDEPGRQILSHNLSPAPNRGQTIEIIASLHANCKQILQFFLPLAFRKEG